MILRVCRGGWAICKPGWKNRAGEDLVDLRRMRLWLGSSGFTLEDLSINDFA